MKLIITKTNLKEGLKNLSGVIKNDSNLNILKNILIKAKNNELNLIATNLEIAITSILNSKIIEEGEVVLNYNILSEIINNLQLERLNIELKNSKLELITDNYNVNLNTLSSEDFPIIPKIKNIEEFIEIKGDIIKNAFNQIISSAQINEIRPELNSVFFNFNFENIKLTTTDSFRLSEKTIPNTQFRTNFKNGFTILIPLKTVNEINKILNDEDDLKIFIDENQILFKTEKFELISRLISGSFPDYESIVPKSFKSEIIVNKEEFISGIKLNSVFSGKTLGINIKINSNKKNIDIFSADQSIGESKYTLSAKIKGEDQQIVFNWKYLLDGLKNIKSEEVFIGLNEENKPALIKAVNDDYYFYIVMPILTI
ncbi:MAG: DNA polymerase III subunit beta [Patescibacteria group bacterium]|nr:DNA polymerase III subunit beta [Patescibacteria group bacterium]MCX7589740.1 DNA polymerase III subunit beta [Patescibacteria group bacterium]MDW8279901.1 DNA polymerase III subunit beta [bacterium]